MSTGLKVLKFGGSSLATANDIRNVASIISDAVSASGGIIVVSAIKGATDDLVAIVESTDKSFREKTLKHLRNGHFEIGSAILSKKAFEEYRVRLDGLCAVISKHLASDLPAHLDIRDEILALGERLSAPLVAACLTEHHRPSSAYDAAGFIRTDSTFGHAKIRWRTTRLLTKAWFESTEGTRVVTGFIGSDKKGRTTTLGRGGSDYTAAVLASILKADVFERWTDVDGIYSHDPGIEPTATRFDTIHLRTARDWNRAGRIGMHRQALDPLTKLRIPVHVRSTFDPKREGTWILP